jgi:glycerophosphoryl diester phosphodiesterase
VPGPLTIAHRAGNDLAALERAAALHIDYAEADVWLHRGWLEVRHEKTAGPLPVLWDRWSLRPSWAPRLALHDVLRAARGRIGLLLDLKGGDRGLAEAVFDAVARVGEATAIACTGGWPHLDRLAGLSPATPRFYTVGGRRRLAALRTRVAARPVAAVSIDGRIATQEVVVELKSRGVGTIIAWAVDTHSMAARLLGWGIDGVTSDDLELLAAARAGRLG